MTAELIDCAGVARATRSGVEAYVAQLNAAEVAVRLATVRVGDDAAAADDERRIESLTSELGIAHEAVRTDGSAAEADVLDTVRGLNEDPGVAAMVVMRPLPAHVNADAVCDAVSSSKDVRGATPENVGLLAMGRARHVPSLAAAAYRVLDAWVANAGRDVEDFYRRSRIVVVGGVNSVATAALLLGCARGAPMALVDPSASGSDQLGWYTRHADVLIVAAGSPGLIRAEHVRDGAIVVDAAMTPVRDHETGRVCMVGDVMVDDVIARAHAVAVGPAGIQAVSDLLLMDSVARAGLAAVGDSAMLQGLS